MVDDFNTTILIEEKIGGSPPTQSQLNKSKHVFNDCDLNDIVFIGPTTTWTNKRASTVSIHDRVDREVATI